LRDPRRSSRDNRYDPHLVPSPGQAAGATDVGERPSTEAPMSEDADGFVRGMLDPAATAERARAETDRYLDLAGQFPRPS